MTATESDADACTADERHAELAATEPEPVDDTTLGSDHTMFLDRDDTVEGTPMKYSEVEVRTADGETYRGICTAFSRVSGHTGAHSHHEVGVHVAELGGTVWANTHGNAGTEGVKLDAKADACDNAWGEHLGELDLVTFDVDDEAEPVTDGGRPALTLSRRDMYMLRGAVAKGDDEVLEDKVREAQGEVVGRSTDRTERVEVTSHGFDSDDLWALADALVGVDDERLTRSSVKGASASAVVDDLFDHLREVATDMDEAEREARKPEVAMPEPEADAAIDAHDLLGSYDEGALTFERLADPRRDTTEITKVSVTSGDTASKGLKVEIWTRDGGDRPWTLRGYRRDKRTNADDLLDMLTTYYADALPDSAGPEGFVYLVGEEVPVVYDDADDEADGWARIDKGALAGLYPPVEDMDEDEFPPEPVGERESLADRHERERRGVSGDPTPDHDYDDHVDRNYY